MTEDREVLAREVGYHVRTAIALHRAHRDDAKARTAAVDAQIAAATDAILTAGFRRHPGPDTIPLSLHNALIEQERRNAATRREERDREWRVALAEAVKPDREDVARALNPVAWKVYDAMVATYPDEPTNQVIVEDSLSKADAVLALWDRG